MRLKLHPLVFRGFIRKASTRLHGNSVSQVLARYR
jgi:hypothetical protein